jgi:hypothetical protein
MSRKKKREGEPKMQGDENEKTERRACVQSNSCKGTKCWLLVDRYRILDIMKMKIKTIGATTACTKINTTDLTSNERSVQRQQQKERNRIHHRKEEEARAVTKSTYVRTHHTVVEKAQACRAMKILQSTGNLNPQYDYC